MVGNLSLILVTGWPEGKEMRAVTQMAKAEGPILLPEPIRAKTHVGRSGHEERHKSLFAKFSVDDQSLGARFGLRLIFGSASHLFTMAPALPREIPSVFACNGSPRSFVDIKRPPYNEGWVG